MIKRKIQVGFELNKLNSKIQECKKCDLHKLEFNIKDIEKGFGKLYGWKGGTKKCKYFFVGMNPSHRRFKNLEYAFGGREFSEGTGIHFVDILKELGIIEECFVDNICKCSTDNNKITDEHIDCCVNFLIKEYEILQPQKVIAMGKQVYQALMIHLPRKNDITDKLYTIWHPNYVISYNMHLMDEYKKKIASLCQ